MRRLPDFSVTVSEGAEFASSLDDVVAIGKISVKGT